jgi:hypothetical protein
MPAKTGLTDDLKSLFINSPQSERSMFIMFNIDI